MPCPPNQRVIIDQVSVLVKGVEINFTQLVNVELLAQALNGLFTFLNPLVVLRAGQGVRLVSTHDNDLVVTEFQWQVPVFQSVAVEVDGVILLPHTDSKLVHNAGVKTYKVVFRLLPQLNQFDLINVEVEFFLEDVPHQHFN